MLLAIDVGNTNSLFALMDAGSVVQSWRISTDPQRTADEYMVWLSQLMGLADISRKSVCDIIIATVVPQALFNIQRLCRKYFDIEPKVVGTPELDLGITVNLPNPREVGADRLVNAVAAHHLYPGDSIIVDFGTATTFDVVDAYGVYQGGIITPGINLSIDALFHAAAKLPRITIEPPAEELGIIGKSTIHAMQSGIFWGYVGMIEGLTARIRAELASPCQVIGTGGLGVLFHKHTNILDIMDVDLTIKGLALIQARQPAHSSERLRVSS